MKENIRKFIGFENIPDDRVRPIVSSPIPVKKQDEMVSLLYAPDPVTKLPSSDIAMMMKNKDNPEVQRYIQQRIQIHHDSVAGSDSADDALSAIRRYKEDVVSYANRLRDNFKTEQTSEEGDA